MVVPLVLFPYTPLTRQFASVKAACGCGAAAGRLCGRVREARAIRQAFRLSRRAQIAFWVQAKDAAACMGLSRFVFLRRARLRAKGLPARSSFALAKCRMLMNAKDFTQIEVAYIQMQKADPDFRRPKCYYW
ncbi:hypothetical protein [uncultured Senegalimassilia sp.]|uniref:hypothetical protein n=1 Tax=uncultured Senegalimassilia sp. TaxID=1714350 RepID=UPI00258EF8D5|nr:hypothetical protein [uncultured Senegalimassilia sp.]